MAEKQVKTINVLCTMWLENIGVIVWVQ